MQINVLPAGDASVMNRMIFPEMGVETQNWIRDQFERGMEGLTELGQQFFSRAKETYDRLNDVSLMRAARSISRHVRGMFHPNTIVAPRNLEDVRNAKPVMARYYMSEPRIRKLYQEQRCDGFSDTYVDRYPDVLRDEHYDYRRVMNGIVDHREIDGEQQYFVKEYVEELPEGERELDITEKAAILQGWDLIRMAIDDGEDPTDIFGGKL